MPQKPVRGRAGTRYTPPARPASPEGSVESARSVRLGVSS
jgi:hypothetical protein